MAIGQNGNTGYIEIAYRIAEVQYFKLIYSGLVHAIPCVCAMANDRNAMKKLLRRHKFAQPAARAPHADPDLGPWAEQEPLVHHGGTNR